MMLGDTSISKFICRMGPGFVRKINNLKSMRLLLLLLLFTSYGPKRLSVRQTLNQEYDRRPGIACLWLSSFPIGSKDVYC